MIACSIPKIWVPQVIRLSILNTMITYMCSTRTTLQHYTWCFATFCVSWLYAAPVIQYLPECVLSESKLAFTVKQESCFVWQAFMLLAIDVPQTTPIPVILGVQYLGGETIVYSTYHCDRGTQGRSSPYIPCVNLSWGAFNNAKASEYTDSSEMILITVQKQWQLIHNLETSFGIP